MTPLPGIAPAGPYGNQRMPDAKPAFCLYYTDEGYSMEGKIMGRQSAGHSLLKGVARRWPRGEVVGAGSGRSGAAQMAGRLRAGGHHGEVRWHDLASTVPPDPACIYYPAPPDLALAHARNARGTASYSLFGVTHTLSSAGAMDQVARLVLPPFQPWDALICTSHAALVVVGRLQDELRGWMREHCGATRFVPIQTPVIPLGVDAPAFASSPADRVAARATLDLGEGEVAFLSAGRLTFHAKANPVPFYQGVEAACRATGMRLAVVETGIYPNDAIRRAYGEARSALAPSARFVFVDGADQAAYRAAWRAADVFVSLSDNIQETFGLTPVEAMAAGLPVLASDWNGYKDTVRDGIDGYLIPTWFAPDGAGATIAARHATGLDGYDRYIGRASLATAVDPNTLADRIAVLARDPALRQRLGEAGRRHAVAEFDWPAILNRYDALAGELGDIRTRAAPATRPWPARPDPFALFGHYPTAAVGRDWTAAVRDPGGVALAALLDLAAAGYSIGDDTLPRAAIEAVHAALAKGERRVAELLPPAPTQAERYMLALMWLVKFGLAAVRP